MMVVRYTVSGNFVAQVDVWVRKAKKAPQEVLRASVMRMVFLMSRPISAGGLMPVVTGYLRSSLRAQSSPVTARPGSRPSKGRTYSPPFDLIRADVNRMPPDVPFYLGYHAVYSRQMEYKYGFLRTAALNWNNIVAAAAREVLG